VEVLVKKTVQAAQQQGLKRIVLSGGVPPITVFGRDERGIPRSETETVSSFSLFLYGQCGHGGCGRIRVSEARDSVAIVLECFFKFTPKWNVEGRE